VDPMARPASVVKCEKHGLHYDSAKANGCVVCRREAGEPPPPRQAAPGSGSLGMPLAVAAVLILVTAFALQAAHGQLQDWLRTDKPVQPGISAAGMPTPDEQKQMEKVLEELKQQSGGSDAP